MAQVSDNSQTIKMVSHNLIKLSEAIKADLNTLNKTSHTNIDGLRQLLIKFTKYYSHCRDGFALTRNIKMSRELAKYVSLQEECENTGVKFVSASAERTASLFVSQERELRDKFEAKQDQCLEVMRTLRHLIGNFVPVNGEEA